jgi:uncharacterized protein YjbJ (UPF0337 family)
MMTGIRLLQRDSRITLTAGGAAVHRASYRPPASRATTEWSPTCVRCLMACVVRWRRPSNASVHQNDVRSQAMDSDELKGKAKEGFGKAKEAWGDATDNPETEAEGQSDQAEGKMQEGWGKVKEAGRDLIDDDDNA